MMNRLIIYFIVLCVGILPFFSWANGGDQRVVENKYLINLSRAPFTPRVGIKTSMLVSFVDIQKNILITEDALVSIRIAKLGGTRNKREFLFEKNSIAMKGGVLEFSYTFADPGLHEIFFDFALASHPQKLYEAPDFLIDVQKQERQQDQLSVILVITLAGGLIAGLVFGRVLSRLFKTPRS